MKNLIKSILVSTFMIAGASGAQAHSFNVLIVGENLAETGAYNGFRLATRERDGHANEESDGHLGGLDSYIFMAEPSADLPSGINILVMLDEGEPPQIIVQQEIENQALRPSIAWAAIIAMDFQARYLAAYGIEADPTARQAYYAAQLVERFVRRNPGFINR
ncbi:MAG: hypothetical protein L3J37_09790 [Rhodobacteraceae bacterium]|nr:hypothetical protein [Paracoccaceae bacterium]